MSGPLVSIVMPTRNRSALLERAISTVVRQSFTDWELIVVDDASSDGTAAVLSARAADDSRIRPLHAGSGAGAAAARNRGIAAAAAPLIAFIDDDDEWLDGKLEVQTTALAASGSATGLVHGPFIEVQDDGVERLVGRYRAPAGRALQDLLSGNQLGHSTVIVRTDVLRSVGGFDERLPRLQDWDLWLRLAARTTFCGVPDPVARVHLTRGSISTQTGALVDACGIMATKYRSVLSRTQHAELCYALGQLLIRHGQGAEGRGYVRRALRIRPWPPRRVAGGVLAHLGPQVYGAAAALYSLLHQPGRGHRRPGGVA